MIPFRDNIQARRFPVVTVLLISVNVAVALYQMLLPARELQALVYAYGMIPARLTGPELFARYELPSFGLTMLTSMFLHGGIMHLAGNMLYLWVFADNVEDRLGPFRFLFFYLACGIGAGLVHVFFNPASGLPTIGASGAVSGVLGAYFLLYPHARILVLVPLLLFFPVIELPALLVLGLWFFFQLLSGTSSLASGQAGGVAWWAHAGGFVLGMVLLHFLEPPGKAKEYEYWEFEAPPPRREYEDYWR